VFDKLKQASSHVKEHSDLDATNFGTVAADFAGTFEAVQTLPKHQARLAESYEFSIPPSSAGS
jgi:hypothetical protein